MKIGIIGAGALGSLLGFYLSQHADLCLFTNWPEQIATVRAKGLVCERDGQQQSHSVQISDDPSTFGTCDLVLVLVKSAQTSDAVTRIRPLLGSHTAVLTLQNGLGNRELLAEQLGVMVWQGVSALGATMLGPGLVRHAGNGTTLLASTPAHPALAHVAELMNRSGMPCELSDQLEQVVWGKLLANVAINALTAILRVPNGILAQSPHANELMRQAVAEAVAVANAQQITLPYADPFAHVQQIVAATSANRSSMLQDVLRGAPSEILAINAAVVRLGQQLGVATPTNAVISTIIQAIDETIAYRVS